MGMFKSIDDGLQGIVYVTFMLTSCTIISYLWIEVSGQDPKSVAKNLQEQNMMWRG